MVAKYSRPVVVHEGPWHFSRGSEIWGLQNHSSKLHILSQKLVSM